MATESAASATSSDTSLTSRLSGLAFQALPAIGSAVGFLGFVAVLGGVIDWVRFQAAQLPASQAVAAVPRSELVSVGAEALILFTLLGVAAVLIVYTLDPIAEGTSKTVFALGVITSAEIVTAVFLVGTHFGAVFVGVLLVVVVVTALVVLYRSTVVEPSLGKQFQLAKDELAVSGRPRRNSLGRSVRRRA